MSIGLPCPQGLHKGHQDSTVGINDNLINKDMVEEAPICFLDMLMEKSLQLIYVDSKQGGG